MPLFEHCCTVETCEFYCVTVEHFFHSRSAANPPCDKCGGATERMASRFSFPWSGDLSRFNDHNLDQHNTTNYGHVAYKTRSTRHLDGTPEPVHITTRQEQKAFIKAEGLIDPAEVNHNTKPNEDGKVSSSRQKGAWV